MLNHNTNIQAHTGPNSPESSKINKLREKMNLAERHYSNPNIDDSLKQPSLLAALMSSPVTPKRSVAPSSHNDSYVNPTDFYVNNFNSLSNSTQTTYNHGETSLSEINPQNGKEKMLKDILVRLHRYKCNWQNVKRIFASFQTKVQLKNPFYYDYLNERDDLTLKILIQILYEEVDNMANYIDQTTSTHKESIENIEKKVQEKEHVCSKLAEEIVDKRTQVDNLHEKLNETYKELSIHAEYFNELGLVFQAALEELSGPALAFNEDKKKRLVNMINKILSKLPSVMVYNNNADNAQKKPPTIKFDAFGNLTTGVKREMTFADLINVLDQEGIIINDYDHEPKVSLLKAHSEPADSPFPKSPQSVLKKESKWFSPDRGFGVNHKKCVSFQDASVMQRLIDEDGSYPVTPSNEEPREIKRLDTQLQKRIEELEVELKNARESIARLIEEKQGDQGLIQRLKIQKGELINKIQTYESGYVNSMSTLCESPYPKFTSGQIDSPRLSIKSPRLSITANASKPTSLRQLAMNSLSKIKEGGELDEDEKSFLGNNLNSEVVGIIEGLREKLKKSEEINRLLISQYENKILDSIEKYEDLKGLCNLILMTGGTIEQSNLDHSPTQWRALKTEFERKREVLQKKMKDLEREQENSRAELKKLVEEEDFLNQLYGTQKGLNRQNATEMNEYQMLKEENQELSKIAKSLASEVTSLKAQVRMMNAVEEHKRSNNSSFLESRLNRTPKQTPPVGSFSLLDDEDEKLKTKIQANQNDLLYMLGAQATALEAFLL